MGDPDVHCCIGHRRAGRMSLAVPLPRFSSAGANGSGVSFHMSFTYKESMVSPTPPNVNLRLMDRIMEHSPRLGNAPQVVGGGFNAPMGPSARPPILGPCPDQSLACRFGP